MVSEEISRSLRDGVYSWRPDIWKSYGEDADSQNLEIDTAVSSKLKGFVVHIEDGVDWLEDIWTSVGDGVDSWKPHSKRC